MVRPVGDTQGPVEHDSPITPKAPITTGTTSAKQVVTTTPDAASQGVESVAKDKLQSTKAGGAGEHSLSAVPLTSSSTDRVVKTHEAAKSITPQEKELKSISASLKRFNKVFVKYQEKPPVKSALDSLKTSFYKERERIIIALNKIKTSDVKLLADNPEIAKKINAINNWLIEKSNNLKNAKFSLDDTEQVEKLLKEPTQDKLKAHFKLVEERLDTLETINKKIPKKDLKGTQDAEGVKRWDLAESVENTQKRGKTQTRYADDDLVVARQMHEADKGGSGVRQGYEGLDEPSLKDLKKHIKQRGNEIAAETSVPIKHKRDKASKRTVAAAKENAAVGKFGKNPKLAAAQQAFKKFFGKEALALTRENGTTVRSSLGSGLGRDLNKLQALAAKDNPDQEDVRQAIKLVKTGLTQRHGLAKLAPSRHFDERIFDKVMEATKELPENPKILAQKQTKPPKGAAVCPPPYYG